jgi:hypothetical protein
LKTEALEILAQGNLSDRRKGELLLALIEKRSFASPEFNGSSGGGSGGGNGSHGKAGGGNGVGAGAGTGPGTLR